MDPRLAEERRKKRLQNQQKREKQILDLAGLSEPPKIDFPSQNFGNNSENQLKNDNLTVISNQKTTPINPSESSQSSDLIPKNAEISQSSNPKSKNDENGISGKISNDQDNQKSENNLTINIDKRNISKLNYIIYMISFFLGIFPIKYGMIIFYISCFLFNFLIPILFSFWSTNFIFSKFIPLFLINIISFGKCFMRANFCLIISRTIRDYLLSNIYVQNFLSTRH